MNREHENEPKPARRDDWDLESLCRDRLPFLELLRGTFPETSYETSWHKDAEAALAREPRWRREFLAAAGMYALTPLQRHALLCLAAHMAREFTDTMSFEDAGTPLRGAAAALVEQGLAEGDADGRLRLSVTAARAFFSCTAGIARHTAVAAYATVIAPHETTQRRLYYPAAARRPVDDIRRVLSRDGYARACAILRRKGRHAAVTALLYGPPGTGKTELARQVARDGGRAVVLADVAKMTASGWGDTEKGYRGLFREYAYLAAVCPVTPVLLLNEADQVLARRLGEVRYSIDKSENAVSDILLQEMEDMDGILLATTNLAGGIDPAFERRFLFKVHVPAPDADTRAKIWRDAVPAMDEDAARTLARDFEMSGGQIANVAARMDLAEICGGDPSEPAFVRSLCEEECLSGVGGKKKRKIGF